MSSTYVSIQHTKKKLGVSECTLRNWADRGWIEVVRTPGGQRLYNINKFINDNKQGDPLFPTTA